MYRVKRTFDLMSIWGNVTVMYCQGEATSIHLFKFESVRWVPSFASSLSDPSSFHWIEVDSRGRWKCSGIRHAYFQQNINNAKMVLSLRVWSIFFIFSRQFFEISASTHWVVTENGRIQAQVSFALAVTVLRLETANCIFLSDFWCFLNF